jgi:hypothetical protein
MKLVPFQTLSQDRRQKVQQLLGIWNNRPVVLASLDRNGRWSLLQDRNNKPVSRNANLIRIRSFETRQQVLDFFSRNGMAAYCKQEDEEEGQLREKRRCFRKRVNLAGEFRMESDGRRDDILIEDLSFDGLRFYSFSGGELFQVGDVLTVRFTLDDRRRSKIKKRAVVRHVTEKHVGVQFLQNDHDPKLGFYLR